MPNELPKQPSKGTPIFIGKSALIRLVNESDQDSTSLWLVDSTNKTLRPFMDESQFDNLFDNPAEAQRAVVKLSSNELGEGGILEDYEVLNNEYGIGPDGSMKEIEFSPYQLGQRYGQPVDDGAENKAVSALDKLFSSMGAPMDEAPETPAEVGMPSEQTMGQPPMPPEQAMGVGGSNQSGPEEGMIYYNGK